MATKKVTITIQAEDLEAIRKLVVERKAVSVSGFVQHAVSTALSDVAGWGALLAQALEETGGELSARERRWADRVLAPPRRTKTKRGRRAA